MSRIKQSLLPVFLVFIFLSGMAQVPLRPDPPRLVNDFAGILQPSQVEILEEMLDTFDRETSTQIAVVTVSTFGGYDRADFAFRIGESWGIGQEGKNNGIVVLVKPKTDTEKGQVYIAVGYGLEAVIPDAVANRLIINNEMIPRFRENDYYNGILNGLKVIMDLAGGEYTASHYASQSSSDDGPGAGLLVILIILIFIILPIVTKGRHAHISGKRDLPLWLLLSMMNSGRKHGGYWGDFTRGTGSFGGSRGGFGGFGGGSFGGGGAGGSW